MCKIKMLQPLLVSKLQSRINALIKTINQPHVLAKFKILYSLGVSPFSTNYYLTMVETFVHTMTCRATLDEKNPLLG